jgi:protein-tyrosine phosphatase/membrane-associated phospholipid phosphatase
MIGDARKWFWKSARTSAALCVLFLVVYGGTNWFTGIRSHVPSIYFEWERHIPFFPSMILPYMSIDLFFIAAPFVVRSDRERRTLAGRSTAAILISGACFLLFPLRFAFERPHVEGVLGLIFNNFRSLDLPFNQFPSLHIALLLILADVYDRNLKGLLRWSVGVWMVLIGLSPLLTWQHHVIDIVGGAVLAVLCFYFFRDQPLLEVFRPNPRIGIYYAGGAVLMAALAFCYVPWTLVLLYPAFSLALIAAGYFFFGAGIYRKEGGKHARTTSIILGPVLLGQRLSLVYYGRRARAWDSVTDHLWIGRQLSSSEARKAQREGVSAVLDLTAEFSEPTAFTDLPYLNVPILDLTAPTAAHFEQAISFIQQLVATGIVYVHCKAGYSRTAAIAGAYLLACGKAGTVEEALAELRRARASLIVRPEVIAALNEYHMSKSGRALVAIR